MNYNEAVAYLLRRERLGIKFGLESISRLAGDLGHPEKAYRTILIAGTNGKGSTAAFLESILRNAGHHTRDVHSRLPRHKSLTITICINWQRPLSVA